jgi:signal transduction histidine kinase
MLDRGTAASSEPSRAVAGEPPAPALSRDHGLERHLEAEYEGGMALAELIPGALHELSNSLFAILGFVELLAADIPSGTRAHGRLELIRASAVDIRDLVRMLRSVLPEPSREQSTVPFAEAVREAVTLARRFALAQDVEIEERYPETSPHAAGGAVEVRNASIGMVLAALRAATQGQSVRIEVTDDGDTVTLAVSGTRPCLDGFALELSRTVARRLGGDLDGSGPDGLTLRLPASAQGPP